VEREIWRVQADPEPTIQLADERTRRAPQMNAADRADHSCSRSGGPDDRRATTGRSRSSADKPLFGTSRRRPNFFDSLA